MEPINLQHCNRIKEVPHYFLSTAFKKHQQDIRARAARTNWHMPLVWKLECVYVKLASDSNLTSSLAILHTAAGVSI